MATRRWLALGGVALGLALGLLTWRLVRHEHDHARGDTSPRGAGAPVSSRLVLAPRAVVGELPGDAALGEALYRRHCVSCHGSAGAGDGPAAAGLHPPPRDHTDGWYMEARGDDDLHALVLSGGPSAQRSPLMPGFGDGLDPLEGWALVAYLRTLHPRVRGAFPAAASWTPREVILPREVAARVAGASLGPSSRDHRAAWLDVAGEGGRALGRVSFPRVDLLGVAVRLVVAVDPDGRPLLARTHGTLRVSAGRTLPTDDLLGGALERGPTVERLAGAARAELVKLAEGPAALAAETQAADALRTRWAKEPTAFEGGALLFQQLCAHCHGATGQLLGAGVQPQAVRPRNLADPAFHASLDDAHLRRVVKGGGAASWLSPLMPSHSHLPDAQLDILVRHVRGLSPLAPPSKDGPP